MMMKKVKIAFISSGNPHTTSLDCAKEINAKIFIINKNKKSSIIKSFYEAIKLGFKINNKYDVYLVESALSIIPILIRKLFFLEKNKIIHRGNSTEYNLILKNEKSNLFRRIVIKFLLKKTNNVIAISKLVKKQVLTIYPNKKISISHTFLHDNSYLKLKPNLKNNNFIIVGNYLDKYDTKGIRNLIKKFNKLYDKKIIKSKLYIIGKNTEKLNYLNKYPNNIQILGFKDPKPYFKLCSFYIHNSKFDAGAVTVLEAMASGLIPIISNKTGNKDILIEAGMKKNIFKYENFNDFLEKINTNYKLNLKEKEKISTNVKKHIQLYCYQEIGKEKFKKTFNEILLEKNKNAD